MEKREQEFTKLRERAAEGLERPAVHLPHHELVVRLWHYPSFDRYTSWLVYSPLPQKDANAIGVRAVWEQAFDAHRFIDPLDGLKHGFSSEPSMSLQQVDLSREELEPRLNALGRITPNAFIDDSGVAVDGASFGIETAGRSFTWRDDSSESNLLIEWCREFRDFLQAYFERK